MVLDDPESLPRLDRVYARYASNMRLALQQLHRRCYRHPNLWLGAHDDFWTARGYTHECLRHHHLHSSGEPVFTPPCDDTSDEAILRWLDLHQPDAVIGPTATLGARLRGPGRRIPEDLGYLAMYVLEADSEWSGISQLHLRSTSTVSIYLNRIKSRPKRPSLHSANRRHFDQPQSQYFRNQIIIIDEQDS